MTAVIESDRQAEIKARAKRLGIANLKAWCLERGIPFTQRDITYALDNAEADALFGPIAPQKRDDGITSLMIMHSRAKHTKADRFRLYRAMTGRTIASSKELTPDEVAAVMAAIKRVVAA